MELLAIDLFSSFQFITEMKGQILNWTYLF